MIIKKPYRKIRIFQVNTDEICEVTDYVIWWLFGIIPLYIIVMDKYTTVNHGKAVHEGVYHWMKTPYK